jgi:uncharacterized membrane protein
MASKKRPTFDIMAAARRVEATKQRRRALGVAGGAALVAFALVPRGLVGAMLAVVGAALVVRSATGQSLRVTARRIGQRLLCRACDMRSRIIAPQIAYGAENSSS